MKKPLLFLALAATVAFTSCSKDDEDKKSCSTCDTVASGVTLTSKYCDNGDGTMTLTVQGQEQTVSLEGVAFETVISRLGQVPGTTCK